MAPPYPYPGYYGYGACYPFASCAAFLEYRLLQRRLDRFDALGSPAPPHSAAQYPLPSAALAPETELQPRYRESGKIRPEYEQTGAPLR
jgi:hypothetical protein